MSKRTRTRHSGAMLASEAAKAWLRQDLPDAVKVQLRLAVKGGRQKRRRCLACGGVGVYVEVFTPHDCMRPMGDGSEGIRVYWTCHGCHIAGLTPELEARLQR